MKKLIIILVVAVFGLSLTSCGTVSSIQNSDIEIAGYTLKNKKELMQQKVLNKKVKTVVAMP
ncbi:hypothetical protein [Ulvibacter antarcticus]|uniref:Uncharacterized protein n=1 Tax=Ulvibacter antarcticus TaxID=442714 RepID=A0A3L9Y8G6_9FLAO|nr:hypothetical protein [Ulvibacter antarcticus]RMA56664.1 hypothetical protein BXY75_3370 [Ulvibacter antarcticus]